MKKNSLLFLFLIITSFAFAYPWAHRYNIEQTNQNIVVDINTATVVSVEWGEGDWTSTSFGYGLTTDGTGWTWVDLPWFQDGGGSNKRCKATISISNPGKYYYAYKLVKSGVTSYSFGSDAWAENSLTLSAISTISVGEYSIQAGNWSSSSTWNSGYVPNSSNVGLYHNVILDQNADIKTLYVAPAVTFTASDATPRTLTITKSTSGSSTTLSNSGTWANGTGGSTVVFTGAPGSGDALQVISGTIGFQNITINKTGGTSNVGASFGSGSTVSGTLEVGTGGFVSTAPPASFYNSSAILKFNQGSGATYDVNAGDYSWSTTEVPQNITISSGTVNLNADRTATGNLLIDGGALVLNSNTPNLTINGNWTRTSGSFTANTGTVTLGGSTNGTVTVTGGATMNSLVISKSSGYKAIINSHLTTSSLTVNSNAILEVNAAKQLTVSAALTNNGTLTLKSNSTDGTATLITPASMSGSGSYTVEQYLAGSRNWYIASPVSAGTMPTAGYERSEINNTWPGVNNGASMTVGKGYIVQPVSNSTVTFTGTVNNNEPTIGLTRTTGQTKAGFNLVGNPYPCYYHWTKAQADAANLLYTVWYRTKEGSYTFHTFNVNGEVSSPASVSSYIPPMQAFWVRVDTDSDGSEDLTFLKANRSHADVSTNLLKAPKVVSNKILRLDVSNGTNSDETVLYFNDNAADTYDGYDSPKMSNNSLTVPELYTVAGSEQLVINGMQNIPLDTEIPLGFRTQETGQTFVIKSTEFTGFDSKIKVFIKDNQNLLNPETELTSETNYSFTSDATDNTTRLSVIFKSAGAVTGSGNLADNNKLSIFADNNKHIIINIGSAVNKPYLLMVYNAVGQKIMEKQTMNSALTLDKALESGVYFVKIDIDGKQTSSKVVIR